MTKHPKTLLLIVAEAVWQYSHHVLAGLRTHEGPILTVANFAGDWPGLVGLLGLRARDGAGLAGFVSLGRFGTASTSTGNGYELTVIAAAVVGGALIAQRADGGLLHFDRIGFAVAAAAR